MDVYVDVLFLENVIINYLILLVTAKFSKSKTSNLRLLLGAVLGASYVIVLIIYPAIKIYYSAAAKIVLSFAIIAVSFNVEKLMALFKLLAIFYISTFIFAGAAFAFLYFNKDSGFVRNGIVYVFWNSKWTVLFLSLVMVGIIIRIFWDILQYKFIKEKQLIPIRIVFENRIIGLAALVDTGNSLHDPLTNIPVVIVEFNAIKELLPSDIKSIFEECGEEDLTRVTAIIYKSTWFSRFRLIPFTSLGKENGMLIGFKPDYIEIGEETEKRGISNVIIGIYNKALSKNERYKALLGPELVA